MSISLSDIRSDTVKTSARAGGFFGWYFTVMYICEQSLHYYHDDTLLASVNQIFLLSALICTAVLAVLLLFFDIEGILNNRLLRLLPGILMGESGIALSFATAGSMTAFSAVAGATFALGALAIMTTLLRVKVGQRLFAISFALAIGGVMRLIATTVISEYSQTGLVIMSIAVGLFTALLVHSEGYTKQGAPLISLAEASPKKILSSVPPIYLLLFIIYGVFFFISTRVETAIGSRLLSSFFSDDYWGYVALAAVSAAIGLTAKFNHLPGLYAAATIFSLSSCALATLSDMTEWEAGVFAVITMVAAALMRICSYTLVIIFSLDRPHPLFYSILGFGVITAAELCGSWLASLLDVTVGQCLVISAALIVFCTVSVAAGMKRSGFTSAQLAHRSAQRTEIKAAAAEYDLTERERDILQYLVIDGFSTEEIAEKLIISRNTARAQQRTLLSKLGLADVDALREHFSSRTSIAEAEAEAAIEKEQHDLERKINLRQELREAEFARREEDIIKKAAEKQAAKAESADAEEE